MDIWMRWNRQDKSCGYDQCQDPILKGEPVVVGRVTKRTKAGIRTYQMSWHPRCWVAQAMDHLNSIPEDERIPKRGRHQVTEDTDLRCARLALLRRRAVIVHRQKHHAILGNVEKVMELEVKKQELIPLILETGPLPRRWVVE